MTPFRTRLLIAALLVLFGAGGRMLLLHAPNIETVMAASILAGALLGGPWGAAVALACVAVTDSIIGNTNILLFTWSAWAVIGFSSLLLAKSDKHSFWFVAKAGGMGLASTLFFYAWTNFGVWLIGGLYPPTPAGLATSYIAGLPFLNLHLLSSLTIVPVTATLLVMAVRTFPAVASVVAARHKTVRSAA